MKEKLEQIKAACREAIALGELATERVLMYEVPGEMRVDWEFRTHARTFSPEAAKALLTTIEGLEEIQSTFPHRHASGIAEKALNQICEEWKK